MSAPDRIWVMFGRRGELEPATDPAARPCDEVIAHFEEYTRATSEADALREENAILRTEKHADAEAIGVLREMLGNTVCYGCDQRIGSDVPRGHVCISCKDKRAVLKGSSQ